MRLLFDFFVIRLDAARRQAAKYSKIARFSEQSSHWLIQACEARTCLPAVVVWLLQGIRPDPAHGPRKEPASRRPAKRTRRRRSNSAVSRSDVCHYAGH